MKTILKANLVLTAAMLFVALLIMAMAVCVGSGAPDWYIYLVYGIIMEGAVWVCAGIGAVVYRCVTMPPMRRGYISYSEKCGWTDEWGMRP